MVCCELLKTDLKVQHINSANKNSRGRMATESFFLGTCVCVDNKGQSTAARQKMSTSSSTDEAWTWKWNIAINVEALTSQP